MSDRTLRVHCNYEKRYHVVPYVVARRFEGVEVEGTQEKDSGFCSFKNLQEFLESIPGWSYRERLQLLSGWKVGMGYKEVTEILPEIEKIEMEKLQDREKSLIFALLYSEIVFINLQKAGKIAESYPKTDELYRKTQISEEETLRDYEREKKLGPKQADQASFDIGLPSGYKVVTRFPPEPSGYLHIGHAKAALLNQYFAETYKGEMIVRMDDTNPEKEKEEFEKSIMEDIGLLGITKYRTTRTSDHFEDMLKLAKKLIEKGLAYCDDTPVEEMRSNRDRGVPSPRRDTPPAENMRVFEKMVSTDLCDKYCLRAKISVDDQNKAMRDPVIYRVNLTPHHHTGNRYRVYPTYDFACPIVDSVEGVTLALRTNEYRDRNAQYAWFLSALDLSNRPLIWDFSRLNFKRTVLSKRKLKWFVEHSKVSGWDDPRMPTVRGILRKGLLREALKEYIISQGPSRNTVLLSWDKVWALNAKMVDPLAKRIHGISKNDLVLLRLEGVDGGRTISTPGRDERILESEVYISKKDTGDFFFGDEITLMGVGSFRIKSTSPLAAEESSTLPKDTKARVTWVPVKRAVSVVVVEYSDLITVDKPEEDQEPHELFNAESKKEYEMLCDERVLGVQKGGYLQIERRGFFICDKREPYVLNLVPGTKQDKN